MARDFPLGALILNKVLPGYFLDPDGRRSADVLCADADALADALGGIDGPALADPAATGRVLRNIGESFQRFSVVAQREAELRAELATRPEVLVTVPSFEADIYDVRGLARIGDHLFGTG